MSPRTRARARALLAALTLVTACSRPRASGSTDAAADAPWTAAPRARMPLDGRAFPDHVIALTWDDGPDAHTLELARYLKEQHVSATFFVVGSWVDGISEEPGRGQGVFETGHVKLPVLGDLVALGHRVGNHTMHHVLLADAPAGTVVRELTENQRALDPLLGNDLRLFRAPGGSWSASAGAAVDADPYLARLIGPVHWDIDQKDWEGSLYCRADENPADCEPAAPASKARVRASVVAARYLAAIESAGHGIVLLHDRVGHVGSRYALDVAQALVPALRVRGFVFTAPVLRFSALRPRAKSLAPDGGGGRDRDVAEIASETSTLAASALGRVDGVHFADVNGDGQADACGRGPEGLVCALSTGRGFARATVWLPEMSDANGWKAAPIALGDLDGDGRADVCGRGPAGTVCALAP